MFEWLKGRGGRGGGITNRSGAIRIKVNQLRKLILVSELPGGPDAQAQRLVMQAFQQMNDISDISPLRAGKFQLGYVETNDKDQEIFNLCKPGGSMSYYVQVGGPNALITAVEDGRGSVAFTGDNIVLG